MKWAFPVGKAREEWVQDVRRPGPLGSASNKAEKPNSSFKSKN